MGFGDYETALKARDVHARLVETVVNRLRPEVRQAEVYDFNTSDMTCDILLPGDTVPLKVKMGRGQVPLHRKMDNPDGSAQGDLVRIAGKAGSYYIVSVYGEEPPAISGLTGPFQTWSGSASANTSLTTISEVNITGCSVTVPVASASDKFLVSGIAYYQHNAADNTLPTIKLSCNGVDRTAGIITRNPADSGARGTYAQTWLVTGLTPGDNVFLFHGSLNAAGDWTVIATSTRFSVVKLEGALGPQGIQGPTGPPNSLGIGSVTNTGPGGSATASITGTAPAQTLSLGIPQGLPGPQGPPGTGSSSAVKDEGTSVVAVPTAINFKGPGVVATANGTEADVTVNGVPVAHSHVEADVTNLVTDLAGKAPVSHTHTKANITDLGTIGTAAAKDVPPSGNASTAQVVMGNDSRLTDTRVPIVHVSTHQPGGSDPLPVDQSAVTGSLRTLGGTATQAAPGNHTHSAAAPAAHATTHQPGGSDAMAVDAAAATGSLRTLGTGATQAVSGTDARLSDARTPTAHTHVATTDLTATGTKNNTTYLRGDNTWAVPPGSGSTVTSYAGAVPALSPGVWTSLPTYPDVVIGYVSQFTENSGEREIILDTRQDPGGVGALQVKSDIAFSAGALRYQILKA